jgi:hypothetical protein
VQLQPGDYPGLAARLNNRVSSVREIAFVRSEPAPVVVGAGEMPRIVLYEHTGFGGRSVELASTIRDLDRINFQDRADAAVVYGGVWRLCVGERGRGECRDFAPGHYGLGSLAGRVSSAELIAAGSAGVVNSAGRHARVMLYEFPNFGGREFAIDRDESLPTRMDGLQRSCRVDARRAATGRSVPTRASVAIAARSARAIMHGCRGSSTARFRRHARPTRSTAER